MNETLFDNEIYDDPYVMLNSRVPRRSVTQKWTYLRSDQYLHRYGYILVQNYTTRGQPPNFCYLTLVVSCIKASLG